VQRDARVWKILRLAFRWGKSANPDVEEEMRRSGHVNESDCVIVDEVRLHLGDLKVSPTYEWRKENPGIVLHAYHKWITHHEALDETRFTLVPVMDLKRHFVTVRPAPVVA
jgi:hypothetical protein